MSGSGSGSGSVFLAVAVLLVVRESAVAWFAFRYGRCDNDDATSDSIACSYVSIYVIVLGMRLGVLLWCRLLFE